MIRTQLELTDEQAAELGEVMEPFQEERLQLMRQDQGLRRRVEAVLIEGSVVDEEAEDLLGRMVELRERELLIFTREQQALRRVLTPSQILQFQVMREQLNERVRALGQQQGARRPPRGGGGGMEPAAGGRGQVHSMWTCPGESPGRGWER
jgi:Spy/CpxP family protein refolding chaperone